MGAASDKSDRLLKRLASSLAKCSNEAAAYAVCVESALPNVSAASSLCWYHYLHWRTCCAHLAAHCLEFASESSKNCAQVQKGCCSESFDALKKCFWTHV